MLVEKKISRAVRVICASGLVMGAGLMAQAAYADDAVQRVEVTGSSLKRVDAETALPVQVVSKAEIAKSGVTSTQELLSTITAIASSGSTSNAAGAGTSTGGLSSISLRGIGDSRTLVLVNGRRLAPFASGGGTVVNVNVIPLSAIERVEVLKDGASGIYGSDAMAGVVNFILAKKYDGIELSGTYGSPTESGGGQNGRASVVAGFASDIGISGVVSASYEKEKALFGKDRSYAKSANNFPYYGAGATGQGNIQGSWIRGGGDDQATGGSGFGNPLAASGKCDSIGMVLYPGLSAKKQKYCAYDSGPDVGLTPDRELINFTGNLNYRVNDSVELFADALYSQSKVTQTFQASPARSDFFNTDALFVSKNVDRALLLDPSNPAYQTIAVPYLNSIGQSALIGKPLAITARVKDFGPRSGLDTASQYRTTIGAKGTIANQDYEVAYSKNQSKLTSSVTSGYFSQVAYAQAINDPNSGWNPWAPGGVQNPALTAKIKAAAFAGDYLSATSKLDTFDGRISGDLFKLGDSAVQYAAGGQLSKQNYVLNPSQVYIDGDIAGLGGSIVPLDRSRTIKSVFGELNVPIIKNLDGNLSVRNDRYDDVGNTTNYKANLRYQPIKSVLLRSSYGTGFRAPTLVDLWYPQTLGTSSQFDDPTTNQYQIQVNQKSGGNPDLKPEKSKQFSLGIVLQPTNNLSFSFDWFRIRISDYISTPSEQEIVDGFRRGDPTYARSVIVDATNNITRINAITANAGTADVQGLDIAANWKDKFAFGGLSLSLSGTYMNKFDQTSPGGQLFGKVGTLVNDIDGTATPVIGANNGGVILRWKHQIAATWTHEAWATTFIQNFSSGYRTKNTTQDKPNFIGSSQVYDLNVTYTGFKNTTLAVGVKNLFNKQPDVFIPASNQFQSGYDIYQYDPRGRFVYATASYKFK
ncbi:TonB-dependent receptor [Undibacterium crateris]|uniref:TonB-dependent receptor n=1 Tax=Undibacterium crateris TaxID=2528175 RepID=UPI001389E5BB|nr:TonB-dependent receptor [Undibacterium crateris]NDI85351.1 TonB-dependent receptor [Undibacterium crateris]